MNNKIQPMIDSRIGICWSLCPSVHQTAAIRSGDKDSLSCNAAEPFAISHFGDICLPWLAEKYNENS